jgi:iron complex outermembrane receptor protein
MSELTKLSDSRADLRVRLLATVCSAGLFAAMCASTPGMASGEDRPTVWVELGGGFAQQQDDQQAYLPPFVLGSPPAPFVAQSPAIVEKNTPYSWDSDAKISFEPEGSDWVFSAAIRYGRNIADRSLIQRTAQQYVGPYRRSGYFAYQNVTAKNIESHMLLDFKTGKDVGLGMFGGDGESVVSLGLRYAQFDSRSSAGIQYQPTNDLATVHKFFGTFTAARKFVGVGPSLSWDASAGLIGNPQAGIVSLDWGMNGAILFGRQRTSGHHQTREMSVLVVAGNQYVHPTPIYITSGAPARSKQVTVPNLGGFAGVSWRYPNAKVSMGYRADFFFGAMDGGIDAAKKENVGFYGPFASVSVGIGG